MPGATALSRALLPHRPGGRRCRALRRLDTIYPGVYHEKSKQQPTAGVWIQKPNLHIRGLDRNRVIIDGSKGTAAQPCPSAAGEQDFTRVTG